jgi:glutamyl-tRNA(Gln) amidotransferase subunit E
MEFKTRKEIIYRIKYETACTYEFDDTPPFPINREALAYAIEIALLTRMNIVGELHITRKQYLDGSIPTGFQRTGIVGIEGLSHPRKNIRVIQLSIEEDSCREVSDIRHRRVYSTDRLGMPLIETVTYPDMLTPLGSARRRPHDPLSRPQFGQGARGQGAAREDVNVSITGGTRVEIKGVAHIAWIPRLTHIEAFRQKALLMIRDELQRRRPDAADWKPATATVNAELELKDVPGVAFALENGYRFTVMKLPDFRGLLAHFTQPGKTFQNELADRLKVIACVERPNLFTEEDLDPVIPETFWLPSARR